MRTPTATLRTIAVVLLVVLTATLATPGRAEADPLAIVGIVSLAIVGVILIVYLIVASASDSRRAEEVQILWIASSLPTPESQSP